MKILIDNNKTAIYYKEKEISYKDLILNIKKIVKFTKIEANKNMMIFMENRPELLYSFFAIWDIKSTCVCIDASSTAKELSYYIEDSDCSKIFTSTLQYEKVKEALKILKFDIEIIVVDKIKLENIKLENINYKNLYIEAPKKEEVVLILYTSGTTGKPKGVMLTFDNILCNIEALDMHNMINENDRMITLLPMHHIFPLLGTGILPLINASQLVFLDDLSSAALMETMKKYKITMLIGVPRLWEMIHKKIMIKIEASKFTKLIFKLAEKINSKTLSKKIFKKVADEFGGSLKTFVSAASKLNPKIAKDFKTLGLNICEGYGMTETSPIISYTPIEDIIPNCAGQVVKNVEVKIADDKEILVRGRNIMKGYYKNKKATAEIIDKDGWLHTGDLGYLDGNHLYITGRKKEMIVLANGKNINPIEIEEKILSETNIIAEIVVLEYNSILTAVIRPDFLKVKEERISNIYENLKWHVVDKYNKKASDYKKILDIKIINEELPKTKIGKIRRFLVPDMLAGKLEKKERKEEPNFEEYNELKKYLNSVKEIEIFYDSHIEIDLAMDSLDIVEFLHFIEINFGIKQEDIISKNPTLLDLANYIKENKTERKIEDRNWNKIINKDIEIEISNSTIFSSFLRMISSLLFNSYFKLNVLNREKLNSKNSIYIGNHQSFIDGFLLNYSLPREIFKDTYYLATAKHFKNPLMNRLAKSSNVILMDKNKDVSAVIQVVAKLLRENKNVVIFPEGIRTRNGELNKFKKSFAILAKELKIDIQPFVIKGAYEIFPPDKSLPKSGKINIEFLDRILIREIGDLSYDEITNKCFELIKKNL